MHNPSPSSTTNLSANAFIDSLVRAAVYVLIVVLLVYTWGLAGYAKLTAGGVPKGFADQFASTFLTSFPGMTVSFYSIAILQIIAAVVATGALLRGEFLPSKPPVVLCVALVLSLLIFVRLGFGKRLIGDHDGAHDLFMYAAGAVVMLLGVITLDERVVRSR